LVTVEGKGSDLVVLPYANRWFFNTHEGKGRWVVFVGIRQGKTVKVLGWKHRGTGAGRTARGAVQFARGRKGKPKNTLERREKPRCMEKRGSERQAGL